MIFTKADRERLERIAQSINTLMDESQAIQKSYYIWEQEQRDRSKYWDGRFKVIEESQGKLLVALNQISDRTMALEYVGQALDGLATDIKQMTAAVSYFAKVALKRQRKGRK